PTDSPTRSPGTQSPRTQSRREALSSVLGALALGPLVFAAATAEAQPEVRQDRRQDRRQNRRQRRRARRRRRQARRLARWHRRNGRRVLVVSPATAAGDVVVIDGGAYTVQRRAATQITVVGARGHQRTLTVVYE
ncbi:MAG: hypothetical protein AAGF12_42450, partial [Myxococcota bacterium]